MVDYTEVLSDLRNRKALLRKRYEADVHELDAAIAAIQKLAPIQTQAPLPGTLRKLTEGTADLPDVVSSPYADMTIREAARRCIENHGGPMHTSQIAEALIKGGMKTEARNFRNTVYGTLARDDDFAAHSGVWSLSSTCRN